MSDLPRLVGSDVMHAYANEGEVVESHQYRHLRVFFRLFFDRLYMMYTWLTNVRVTRYFLSCPCVGEKEWFWKSSPLPLPEDKAV